MTTPNTRGPIAVMSAPKRDILALCARDGPVNRFDLRDGLQQSGKEIAESTAYQHLETFVDIGYVERTATHRKMNQYQITRDGLRTLNTHRAWLNECLDDAAPVVEVQR